MLAWSLCSAAWWTCVSVCFPDGEGEEGPAGGGDMGPMEEEEEEEGPEEMGELEEEEDDTDEEEPAPFWRARNDPDVAQPDTDPITFDPSLPGAHSVSVSTERADSVFNFQHCGMLPCQHGTKYVW